MKRYTPKHLELWTRADNYMGETYYDYYQAGFGRSRDSDILEESNFECALDKLGGESSKVLVARSSHWACGWVECILIHKTAYAKLKIADQLAADFKSYPIVNESDFSERELEYITEYAQDTRKELATALAKHFGLKVSRQLMDIAYELNVEWQYYAGTDACIDIYDFRVPGRRDLEDLKTALKQLEYSNLNASKVFQRLRTAVEAYQIPEAA